MESIVIACTKNLDNADQETRRALSGLVGHILASTQTAKAAPPPDTSKKGKKELGDEEDVATSSAAMSEGTKTIMTPSEMLSQLSTLFNKPNTSRKTRIGLFDFYSVLISTLGSTFVEANYATIVKHFLEEIVAVNPRPASAVALSSSALRYETLLVRKLVGIVLRDLIGVRLLSEQGQIAAIQELSRSYLKKWPALMPGQVAPTPAVLVIVLKEVAGLVQQLGNAPPPVQV